MFARLTARRALHAMSLLGVAALWACSESPTSSPDFAWRSGSRTFGSGSTTSSKTAPTPTFIRFAPWAPKLTTYDTSFVVVVGTASAHQVYFKGTQIPFLKVEIPANADFFGATGLALPQGTVAAVSVTIDPVYATVVFGPHGTLFTVNNPAKLYLNYWNLDLGGRMPTDVNIWYRPDTATSWAKQATNVDVTYWWLITPIYHFSNYAIAY